MNGAPSRQRGFTLIEMLIAVAIFGALLVMVGPTISAAFTYREQAKRDEIGMDIKRIGGAVMNFARTTNNGRLPAPYTGGDLKNAVYNPAGTTSAEQQLAMELRNTGVTVEFINNDSTVVRNARVYQRVAGLTYDLPFYFVTGTKVTLTYDVGSIVQTKCAMDDTCYTGATATDPAGDSDVMTSANMATWMPAGEDYGAVMFSTLPDQKGMLRTTIGRVNRLTDRLSSEFYTRMRLAAADSKQNFFPLPLNAGAPNYSGRNPPGNFGCHNGWYALNAADVDVLSQIGLDPAEYGVTAWGGAIEYCQDYEPTAVDTTSAGIPPHYAAVRLNKNVSAGTVPNGIDDVIITF